ADPLDVERHLVGPVNRLTPILVIRTAIGADALGRERPAAAPSGPPSGVAVSADRGGADAQP
ncbi:MAG: hypothetical protein ACR2HV_01885, partial [Acidimicrobiales bacterium]